MLSTLAAGLVLLNPTQAQTAKGKKYALLVGVRSYDHRSLVDLKHTENDVEELAALLGKSSFSEVVVLTTTRGEKRDGDKPTAKNIRAALEIGSNEAVKEAVARGVGVAVLSIYAVRKEVEAGHLIALEGSDLKCDRDFFVVRDKRRVLPPPARMFLSFFRTTPVPAPAPARA